MRKPGKQKRRWFAGASLALTLILPLLAAGCGSKSTQATQTASSGPDLANANASVPRAELFSVPPEQMSHVQVVAAQASPLRRVLRLTGSVAYNSFQTTPVIPQVGGRVARILVYPGDTVHAGQPMFYVASTDYAQSRSGYLKAKDAFALAQENDKRAKDLYAHHAIAQADLLASDSALQQAEADLQAAAQSLRVLGISDLDQVVQDPKIAAIAVLAPISGEVVERMVAPGQVVQAGQTQAFTISNMKTVWVLANVYQHDIGSVRVGDPVTIRTDAYPTLFHGRISYIASALDPNTRTLPVRIVTDNPGGKLKKDMYVTATVRAAVIRNALTVPDAAVLRTPENQPFVYVAVGKDRFAQRLVSIGESENGRTQIIQGLREGEPVVGDGSLFLQFANSLQR